MLVPFFISAGVDIGTGITITYEILTAPINTVLPVISGSATAQTTLTTDDGTWTAGNPAGVGPFPITYAYQWQKGTTDIPGETSNSYLLDCTDVGSTIRCVVTATNSKGSTTVNTADTAVVVPNVPNAPTSVIVSSASSTTANVSWTASTDDGCGTISEYEISAYKLISSNLLVTGVSYTINNVGTTDFTLVGASSNTVGVVFTATGTTTGTGNAYSAPSTSTVSVPSTSTIVTGLDTGGLYFFRVAATNESGTGPQSSASTSEYIIPFIGEFFGGGYVIRSLFNSSVIAAPDAGGTVSNQTLAQAQSFCNALVLNTYSDWTLPSRTNMQFMASASGSIPYIAAEYHTGTFQSPPSNYYTVTLPGGIETSRQSTFACYCRAIRTQFY